MKKLLIIILAVITTAGCFTFSQIEKNKKQIDLTNGVNEIEAILIAQDKLLESEYKSYDKIIPAKIRNDEAALKHPDYWFVDYTPAVPSNYPSLLIVINKMTGDIKLSKEYWPNVVKDLDWAFKN